MEKIVFFVKGEDPTGVDSKKIVLSYDGDNLDFDMDELTQIRFDNIFGEIVTASALLNRIGIVKAKASNDKRLKSIALKEKYAELFKHFSNKLIIRQPYKTKEGEKLIYPTNTAIEQEIVLDKVYQFLQAQESEAKFLLDIADTFYWSVQDKCKKLGNIKENLKPEDFLKEIIEGEINGFQIKIN
jgi:hypothetical protein